MSVAHESVVNDPPERARTVQRRENLDLRELLADERDRLADERDRVADERDRTADERDRAAAEQVQAAEDELAGLGIAMSTRAVIEQAKGMIMITLEVDADTAFDVLVRRSQSSHVKLVEVAREIVRIGTDGK